MLKKECADDIQRDLDSKTAGDKVCFDMPNMYPRKDQNSTKNLDSLCEESFLLPGKYTYKYVTGHTTESRAKLGDGWNANGCTGCHILTNDPDAGNDEELVHECWKLDLNLVEGCRKYDGTWACEASTEPVGRKYEEYCQVDNGKAYSARKLCKGNTGVLFDDCDEAFDALDPHILYGKGT